MDLNTKKRAGEETCELQSVTVFRMNNSSFHLGFSYFQSHTFQTECPNIAGISQEILL